MKFQELAGLTDFALVIRVDAFSELMLNHLMNVTKEALASTSETHDMLQVTALHTTGEKIYTGISYGPQSGEQLIEKLKEVGYDGALTIEREITGPQQRIDIIKAKEYLEKLL